jgi:hypothetical protein
MKRILKTALFLLAAAVAFSACTTINLIEVQERKPGESCKEDADCSDLDDLACVANLCEEGRCTSVRVFDDCGEPEPAPDQPAPAPSADAGTTDSGATPDVVSPVDQGVTPAVDLGSSDGATPTPDTTPPVDATPPVSSNNVKIMSNLNFAAGLDARNGHLTWVQLDRIGSQYDAATYGGEVRAAHRDTSETYRVVAPSGAGPAIDEQGRVAYGVVQVPERCTWFFIEGDWHYNNCGNPIEERTLPQYTSISFRNGQVAFTMKPNNGDHEQNDLWYYDIGQRLFQREQSQGSITRPRLHDGLHSFSRTSSEGGTYYTDSLVFSDDSGSWQFDGASAVDAGGDWIAAAYNDDFGGRVIRMFNTRARTWSESYDGLLPFVNDDGSIIMWTTREGFRYWRTNGIDGPTVTFSAREAVLDGTDIYYITPDENGVDALYRYILTP